MELFQHQKEAIEFIGDKPGVIIADDMGLGKTATAIMAMQIPAVVVCPATVRTNWKKEIETWRPNLEVSIVGAKKKDFDWGSDVIVINYDRLNKTNMEMLLKRMHNTVVFDEAQYLKSLRVHKRKRASGWELRPKGANRAKAAWTLVHKGVANMRVMQVLALTGTPAPNGLHAEWFALLNLTSMHKIAETFPAFARVFCPEQTKWVGREVKTYDVNKNSKGLRKSLESIMIRRLKSEALDLPDKVRSVKSVDIDAASRKEYTKIKKDFINWIEEKDGPEAAFAASRAETLVQLGHLRRHAAMAKLPVFIDDIKELLAENRPVVVMAHHKDIIAELKMQLEAREFTVSTITGDDSLKKRDEAIDSFQKGNLDVVICSIMAAGVGITLTRSTDMLFLERAFRPADVWQAEDRIYRIGQDHKCFVTYYDAVDTIDENLADMLNGKILDIASVIKCML